MTEFIEEANDGNFEQVVLEPKRPVLVDFWAKSCVPCCTVAPIVGSVAKSYPGAVQVAKLNVDNNPSVAWHYRIQAIPTLILFQDGEEKDHMIGVTSKEAIARTIYAHMGAA